MEGKKPILLGEFGGRSMSQDTEGIWQRSLVSYVRYPSAKARGL
jgi:hypothetical protein